MTDYRATKADQLTLRVYWDRQDPKSSGWAYRLYDGGPNVPRNDWVEIESGPIEGRQSEKVPPSRARVLRSAAVCGGRYVHLLIDD